MKTIFASWIVLSFIYITSAQTNSNPYFPLEVGNRWDYWIECTSHGSHNIWEDTISLEIIGTELLPNGIEYFVYSDIFPMWSFSQTKYVRYEDGCVYFYKVKDSTDCFAFRFDLPEKSTYYDCNDFTGAIDVIGTLIFGNGLLEDTAQYQRSYVFLKSYGIYKYFIGGLVDFDYQLSGCIISGKTYGNLIADASEQQTIEYEFELDQNYPNPFNPSTTIKCSIPQQSYVTLKIYDLLGREVATLVNEEKPAGYYETEFDGSNLPSGVYFYQLKAGGFVETKKMILLL